MHIQVKAQNLLYWPILGFHYEDVQQLYIQSITRSHLNYEQVGEMLWEIADEHRAELKFTGSISQSVNSLLTFIELQVWKEENSSTLSQIDGGNDSEEDLKNIPPCLGNLECADENLFHTTSFIFSQDS